MPTPLIVKPSRDLFAESTQFLRPSEEVENAALRNSVTSTGLDNIIFQNSSRGINELTADRKLTAKQANELYGIEGALSFEDGISENEAQRKRGLEELKQKRQEILARADMFNSPLDKAGNILKQIGWEVNPTIKPENFIPVTTIFKLHKLGKLWAPLAKAFKNPVTRGMIDSGLDNAAIAALVSVNQENIGVDYSLMDGAFEVLTGVGLGASSGGLRRAIGGVALKNKQAVVRSKIRASHIFQTAGDQISPETRGLIGDYIGIQVNAGKEVDIDAIKTFITRDSMADYTQSNSGHIFTGEGFLRNDLTRLTPETRLEINEVANKQPLFGRGDLDPVSIKKTDIPTTERGTYLAKDIAKATGFKIKDINRELNQAFGLKNVTGKTELTPEQASLIHALGKEIELNKKQSVDLSDKLLELQNKIRKAESGAKKTRPDFVKDFKKTVDKVFKKIDRNDFKLEDFFNAQTKLQADVVRLMKYIQEANVKNEVLERALGKDDEAIELLYEQLSFNNEFKANVDPIEIENMAKKIFNDVDKPAERPNIITETFASDGEMKIQESFFQEKIDQMEAFLSDEQIQQINADVEAVAKMEEGKFKAIKEGIKRYQECV